MNTLTHEMKRSLRELDLGLKGELTITSDMEDLSNSLFFDQVRIGKNGDFFFNNPILFMLSFPYCTMLRCPLPGPS